MSTNFPGSLDTSTTIPAESASTPLSTNHVTAHQNIQDAIEAIEAKVGADSSATTTSHDYKLGEVTGSDKAVSKTASQTLTNKTLTSPVITSPTLNLGSDAEGDTYYRNSSGALVRLPRGTDNYIYKMNGNVPNWEVEATVSAATESAEGISRLATAAQITAGTASESGFPLVVTPDQLALSTPTFNGSLLTNLPLVIGTKVSTLFETSGRFTGAVTGSGANSYGTTGVVLSNGGGSAGSNNVLLTITNSSNDLYLDSPLFHATVTLGDHDGNLNSSTSFFGIGNLTVASAGITLTGRHVGFKFLKTGGATTLYGTQADGSTETASSALSTGVNGDIFDLYFRMNNTTSVDYYWRKNGGSLSSAVNLTTNIPSTTTITLQCAVSTNATGSAAVYGVFSMSYERK